MTKIRDRNRAIICGLLDAGYAIIENNTTNPYLVNFEHKQSKDGLTIKLDTHDGCVYICRGITVKFSVYTKNLDVAIVMSSIFKKIKYLQGDRLLIKTTDKIN